MSAMYVLAMFRRTLPTIHRVTSFFLGSRSSPRRSRAFQLGLLFPARTRARDVSKDIFAVIWHGNIVLDNGFRFLRGSNHSLFSSHFSSKKSGGLFTAPSAFR